MTPHFLPPPATFLLFILLLSPPTTFADTAAVLDTDGNPLEANVNYYILPVDHGQGGGLTLLPKNNTALCPLYVGQATDKDSKGLPVKFFPVDPEQNLLALATDVNIEFDAATICITSTVWSLTFEEGTGRRLVGIGGTLGNPGRETLSNWFNIQKAGSGKYDYKIVFCPSVCQFCTPLCGELGVFVEPDGRRLLGATDQPLLVNFKKA